MLQIKLQWISDGDEFCCEFQNARIIFTVGAHNFVKDRHMNLEDYHSHSSVLAPNIGDGTEPKKCPKEFARKVFQKLKASQWYPLMLVEDVQVKLQTFCPE